MAGQFPTLHETKPIHERLDVLRDRIMSQEWQPDANDFAALIDAVALLTTLVQRDIDSCRYS